MTRQRLWAPWRMKYVQGERKGSGCIFCLADEPSNDDARHVLHRGQRCFVMLNAFPYNSGHLMVCPYRHVASIRDLDADEVLELMTLTQRSLRALREAYRPTASTWASTKARSPAPASPATSTSTSSPAGRPTATS